MWRNEEPFPRSPNEWVVELGFLDRARLFREAWVHLTSHQLGYWSTPISSSRSHWCWPLQGRCDQKGLLWWEAVFLDGSDESWDRKGLTDGLQFLQEPRWLLYSKIIKFQFGSEFATVTPIQLQAIRGLDEHKTLRAVSWGSGGWFSMSVAGSIAVNWNGRARRSAGLADQV